MPYFLLVFRSVLYLCLCSRSNTLISFLDLFCIDFLCSFIYYFNVLILFVLFCLFLYFFDLKFYYTFWLFEFCFLDIWIFFFSLSPFFLINIERHAESSELMTFFLLQPITNKRIHSVDVAWRRAATGTCPTLCCTTRTCASCERVSCSCSVRRASWECACPSPTTRPTSTRTH